MPTDYEIIRRDNIEEYGKGTRHLEFLGRLYSDKTHFLYELLQNAEDARASRVSFVLEPTRLVFKHDGKELFNEKHIRGVCGVAEGTKAEDETKIGKFGIGFKSVYAYTRMPEIHCADEHFRIEHFVRPFVCDSMVLDPPWTTLFIFPFSQEVGASPEQAFIAIRTRLHMLGVQTLLFLRNLHEIEWEVQGGARGFYRSYSQSQPGHRRVTLHAQFEKPGEVSPPKPDEDWLVFEKRFALPGKPQELSVEAAFRLVKDPKTNEESIRRLANAPLVVYFPTAIQTGLGFLIQGPYRTTPARDNIEEDHPLNETLLAESGELIVESLRTIKNLGLLTIEVLNALPLKQTLENDQRSVSYGFRPEQSREEKLFAPITSRVAKALKEEELLPASSAGFVAGNAALLARSFELRELLSSEQIRSLFVKTIDAKWLTEEITADRTPSIRAYLMATIGVQEITPEGFAQKLTKDFLLLQSDDWFVSFYSFLAGQRALWREFQNEFTPAGPLRCDKPILRLQDDSLLAPFRRDGHPNAFLPPEEETEFPIVKKTIASNPKAREFLVSLGLTAPDLVDEVIEKVLVKYLRSGTIAHEENLHDVARIAAAAKTDSKSKRDRLLVALRKTHFLLCRSADTGNTSFQVPGNIHFDSPDLRTYFAGNPAHYFLFEGYNNTLFDFFSELGVANQVGCQFRPTGRNGYVVIRDQHSCHIRGLNGFDPGFEVEGLEFALSHPNLERSTFIWNQILVPHSGRLSGEVEESSRQDFNWSCKDSRFSRVGELAFTKEWLPDSAGNWHRPKGYAFSNLPDGFQPSESVCRHLQMEFVSVSQLAEKAGIPVGDLETLKALMASAPEKWEEIKRNFVGGSTAASKPKFPERAVTNPDRRDEKVRDKTGDSPNRTYESKERSVRTSRPDLDCQAWLANQYTNEDGQMICQMCETEMPFKKRDGNHYFEAVEAFDDVPIERHELFLALCPVCAAKYKEFVKRDLANSTKFKVTLISSESTAIPIQIGSQECTVRFVETHLFDLRIILAECSSDITPPSTS